MAAQNTNAQCISEHLCHFTRNDSFGRRSDTSYDHAEDWEGWVELSLQFLNAIFSQMAIM